jgi:hypothetical protein
MAGKQTRRGKQHADQSVHSGIVKVTLRLNELTAKRLGVESVMSGESQSDIAERVLSAYLSAWRLPSKVGGTPHQPSDPSGGAENAA